MEKPPPTHITRATPLLREAPSRRKKENETKVKLRTSEGRQARCALLFPFAFTLSYSLSHSLGNKMMHILDLVCSVLGLSVFLCVHLFFLPFFAAVPLATSTRHWLSVKGNQRQTLGGETEEREREREREREKKRNEKE